MLTRVTFTSVTEFHLVSSLLITLEKLEALLKCLCRLFACFSFIRKTPKWRYRVWVILPTVLRLTSSRFPWICFFRYEMIFLLQCEFSVHFKSSHFGFFFQWKEEGISATSEHIAAIQSKMESFVTIVKGWKPLTIVAKLSISDVHWYTGYNSGILRYFYSLSVFLLFVLD